MFDRLFKKNSTRYREEIKIEKRQGLLNMEDQKIQRHTTPTL